MEPAATTREQRASIGLLHLLQVVAVNAVPIVGLWYFGWGSTTTLALYWCENVLGSLFVLLRLVLHERLTHDPGYAHNQLGVSTRGADGRDQPVGRYIPEFISGAFIFSAAHGLFLAFLIAKFLPEAGGTALDPVALRRGLAGILAILMIGFLVDLRTLGRRPFSWARDLGKRAMGRVIVVHLTIILGFIMLAWKHEASAFLATFAGFKLLFDLGATWPKRQRDGEPGETPNEQPGAKRRTKG